MADGEDASFALAETSPNGTNVVVLRFNAFMVQKLAGVSGTTTYAQAVRTVFEKLGLEPELDWATDTYVARTVSGGNVYGFTQRTRVPETILTAEAGEFIVVR